MVLLSAVASVELSRRCGLPPAQSSVPIGGALSDLVRGVVRPSRDPPGKGGEGSELKKIGVRALTRLKKSPARTV